MPKFPSISQVGYVEGGAVLICAFFHHHRPMMARRLGVFFHNTIVLPEYPLFIPFLCFLSTSLPHFIHTKICCPNGSESVSLFFTSSVIRAYHSFVLGAYLRSPSATRLPKPASGLPSTRRVPSDVRSPPSIAPSQWRGFTTHLPATNWLCIRGWLDQYPIHRLVF